MSIITIDQLKERLQKGEITFTPELDTFQVHAHSVDLRLGYTFLVPKRWHMTNSGREALLIDHNTQENQQHFDVIELEKGQFFDLLPGEYVSVSTLESVKVPSDLMAVLYPRSSTNRRGLSVDLTGIVDAGYEGQLMIPVRNNTTSHTIRIYPGERFCQIVFEKLSNIVTPRESRYHKKDIIEGYIPEKKYSNKTTETDLLVSGNIKELKETHKFEF